MGVVVGLGSQAGVTVPCWSYGGGSVTGQETEGHGGEDLVSGSEA